MTNKEKRKKALLFFGFYFVFFLILFLNMQSNKKIIEKLDENIVIKDEVIDNNLYFGTLRYINYQYDYEVNDNNEIISYHGTKTESDYNASPYKYFFDIYNINQLIKKSKVVEKIDNYTKYSLANENLDELLESETQGNTIIEIKENEELEIDIDLHEYYKKDLFKLKLLFRRDDIND